MKKTIQELEAEARETQALRTRTEEYGYRFTTADQAERLANATYGGYYTNPELTAALGLSDMPIDASEIHRNSQRQATQNVADLNNRTELAKGIQYPTPTATETPFSIQDLLRMAPQELAVRHDHQPDWWDKVDPTWDNGLNWRRVPVPQTINNAEELMQLQDVQVTKLYLSMTPEEWNAIPGMIPKDTVRTDGTRTGKFDSTIDLPAKFPFYKKLVDAEMEMNKRPDAWSAEYIAGNLIMAGTDAMKLAGIGLSVVPKTLGFFAPDHIGPAGGFEIESAGITIPSRISVKEIVGKPIRATTKTITGVTFGAAQATKNLVEQVILEDGKLSLSDISNVFTPGGMASSLVSIMKDPEKRANFQQSVIQGNILTQIAKQAVTEGELDVGGGYFPAGKAGEAAIAARDAVMPEISGKTWTVGRALVEPLIKEGFVDRDGYAASFLSGIADGVFTAITDPTLIFDPLAMLMKSSGLKYTPALKALDGAPADKVYDAWKAARIEKGLSTIIPREIIDMNPGRYLDDGTDIVRFGGMLPEGTVLPPEVQQVVDDLANETIGKNVLANMDAPPLPAAYVPVGTDIVARKAGIGVAVGDDGTARLIPRAIDEMPFTRDGRLTLNKLSSFTNAGELYDYFLGKIPVGLAVEIQDIVDVARAAGKEVNLKDVHKALTNAAYSGDPLYNIAEVPGVIKRWTNQTGGALAHYVSGETRQFATMPKDVFFSFSDPLSSISDMNRLMTVMKVPKELRHSMLSKTMKYVAGGNIEKRFELAKDWAKLVLQPALSKNGVPQEWIDIVSDWAGKGDEIYQWSFDALGDGYVTSWFEDGTGEVLRSIDMIPKGFMMVHPDKLKQVMRETTNLWRVLEPFRNMPNSAASKRLNKMLTMTAVDWLEKNVQQKYLKPIALGAPLPVRMVTRILPDELLRIAVSEGLSVHSLKAMGAMGHLNYNTAGVAIRNGKEVAKLHPVLEQIDSLRASLMIAKAQGDATGIQMFQDLLDGITKQFGTKKEILDQIKLYELRIDESLPGTGRKLTEISQGLMADERKLPQTQNYERRQPKAIKRNVLVQEDGTRFVQVDGPESKQWVIGTARDLVHMSESPEYREVAKAMLAGGGTEVMRLPQRFLSGDLKEMFDQIYEKAVRSQGAGAMSSTAPLTSVEGNTAWVATTMADIMQRTQGDAVAIGVVATGKLGTESVSAMDGWKIRTNTTVNVFEATESLRNWVKNNLLTNPDEVFDIAPFAPSELVENINRKERLLTRGFSLYRDASAKYARNPLKDYAKWQRIVELIPAMDPQEAAKMAAALEKSDMPVWMTDSVKAQIPQAAGTATRKQVEILGEMYGNQRMDNLLYSGENKTYFGSRHSLLFAFFDAWKEQWSVWGRLMAENPSMLERARVLNEGTQNAEVPEWAGGQPGRGIVFKDEDTGEQAVALPFTRELYSMLGLNGEERIKLKNWTLMGNGVPGFFGVGAIIADSFIPKQEPFLAVRSLFNPFGDPQMRSKLADYIAPIWLQGLVGAGTSQVAGGQKIDLFNNLQEMFATEGNDSIRSTTFNAVLNNIATNRNGLPITTEQRANLEEDVTNKTDYLLGLKSFMKIFLPAASYTKFFMETKSGNITTGAVLDEYSAMIKEAQDAGRDSNEATIKLFQKYGDGVWILLAGGTQRFPGLSPSKAYIDWLSSNSGLVDKYELVAGYLGPQNEPYDPKAFIEFNNRGWSKAKEIGPRIEEALGSVADTQYYARQDALVAIGLKQGLTPAQTKRSNTYSSEMRALSEELKTKYPFWDVSVSAGESEDRLKKQLIQIEQMVNDSKVTSLPAGEALKQYWDYRTRNVAKVLELNPALANEAWKKKQESAGFRAKLTQMGEALVEKYPDFASMWEKVLSREFDPPEIGQ
jgi:hypothetical protein